MSVPGFDYTTGKDVAHTPKEWRQRYPAATFRRVAEGGETAYYRRQGGGRVAEAYAVVPSG